ncbi:hypothetical protein GCM10010231_23240 [Streptomyces sindenensis]|nr:hypothetical protein GCM10010231_23240 [Streptomyces sindenensis]
MFRDHAQIAYRCAVRTGGDRSAAEGVVSLTFLEAWRLRGKLRGEGASPRHGGQGAGRRGRSPGRPGQRGS